jgi:hypothetical protein
MGHFRRLGFTCASAERLDTLTAVTVHRTDMQPSISMSPAIRSSMVTIYQRDGGGVTWRRLCSIYPIELRRKTDRSLVITSPIHSLNQGAWI